MATNIPNFLTPKVICGLDTYNYTIVNAGMHVASINLTEQPPSGMSILIQQNGSTKASFSAPAASQNHIDLKVTMNCAANDIISFVLSSSNAGDQQLNSIKGILIVHQGSSN